MNANWMKAQDRKRNLVAAGSTACLYALAFAAVLIVGHFSPQSLASISDTVTVDLGAGPAGATPRGLPNAAERPAGSPPGTAPLPAPATSVGTPAPAPSATPSAAPSAAVQATDTQAEAALRAAAATAAAPPGPPQTRTFGSVPATATAPATGSSAAGAPVTSGFSGSQSGVSGGTGTVTFRGSEMGSTLATTFGASSGQVGRNIYVPIYLYMPLPSKVSAAIYRNIQAKETFRAYYQQSGSDWVLKTQAPLSQRGDFWTMLEAAGYDPATADFRTQKTLSGRHRFRRWSPHARQSRAGRYPTRLVIGLERHRRGHHVRFPPGIVLQQDGQRGIGGVRV